MADGISETERTWWEEAGRVAIQTQDLSRESSQARLNELARAYTSLINRVTFDIAPERQAIAHEYVHGLYTEMQRVFAPEFAAGGKVSEFLRKPFSETVRVMTEVVARAVGDAGKALLSGFGVNPEMGMTTVLGIFAVLLLAFIWLKEA